MANVAGERNRGVLRRLLAERQLVLFVGEGGVGKTSCAAALALALAAEGKRIAVLTIDPAPRLGDALGLDALGSEWREVAHTSVRDAGGRLVASRLDTKYEFDRLVARFAPTPAVARRILASPIYATLSDQLGGADSYMAFQRLHEMLESDAHDVLVVDTPPAQHADEILGAPARLARLFDTGALAMVADPALALARAGSAVAAYTIGLALRGLERVTGSELRRDLADFATSFEAVAAALTRRAGEVTDVLRSSRSVVVEVVRPDHHSVVAAASLRRSLAAADLTVACTIVNRMTPNPAAAPSYEPVRKVAATDHPTTVPPGAAGAEAAMAAALRSIRDAEIAAVDTFERALAAESGDGANVVRMAAVERGIETPDALIELGRSLLRS
jgi:anion-transporting  ArsA/GET3 family ATPase